MKNLYTKNEYLNIHKEYDSINEGFLGKMFKGLWKGVVKLAKRIKGSSDINKIYDKYKALIDETFTKLNKINSADGANKTEGELNKTPESEDVLAASPTHESKVNEDLEAEGGDKEHNNLANLDKNKIAQLTKMTSDRIKEIKAKFEGEINVIVNKLSKNSEYSSDNLKQYSIVMKNQFNSYMFDQWYGFYQNSGDKDKMLKITEIKKKSDLKYKQSIQDLNTELGEKQKTIDIVSGGAYTYDSKNLGSEITINVIGKEMGQDETGKPDRDNPEHNKMWKVKHEDSIFWISPSSFKGVASNPDIENDIVNSEKPKEAQPAQPAQPAQEVKAEPKK